MLKFTGKTQTKSLTFPVSQTLAKRLDLLIIDQLCDRDVVVVEEVHALLFGTFYLYHWGKQAQLLRQNTLPASFRALIKADKLDQVCVLLSRMLRKWLRRLLSIFKLFRKIIVNEWCILPHFMYW